MLWPEITKGDIVSYWHEDSPTRPLLGRVYDMALSDGEGIYKIISRAGDYHSVVWGDVSLYAKPGKYTVRSTHGARTCAIYLEDE